MDAAREHPAEGVPMHIRNAPTGLMKELGYGAGYQYAHDAPEAYIPQEYLPERLRGLAVLRAGSVRVREGDREAAGVVGRASTTARAERAENGVTGINGEGDAMRRLALAVAASAAVAVAGCSALGRAAFEEPVVTSASDVADCAASDSPAAALDVMLSVYNPNHYRLDATRLTYQGAAAGDSVTLASGRARQPVHGAGERLRRSSRFR